MLIRLSAHKSDDFSAANIFHTCHGFEKYHKWPELDERFTIFHTQSTTFVVDAPLSIGAISNLRINLPSRPLLNQNYLPRYTLRFAPSSYATAVADCDRPSLIERMTTLFHSTLAPGRLDRPGVSTAMIHPEHPPYRSRPRNRTPLRNITPGLKSLQRSF